MAGFKLVNGAIVGDGGAVDDNEEASASTPKTPKTPKAVGKRKAATTAAGNTSAKKRKMEEHDDDDDDDAEDSGLMGSDSSVKVEVGDGDE
jgi:hypothetical protein